MPGAEEAGKRKKFQNQKHPDTPQTTANCINILHQDTLYMIALFQVPPAIEESLHNENIDGMAFFVQGHPC